MRVSALTVKVSLDCLLNMVTNGWCPTMSDVTYSEIANTLEKGIEYRVQEDVVSATRLANVSQGQKVHTQEKIRSLIEGEDMAVTSESN